MSRPDYLQPGSWRITMVDCDVECHDCGGVIPAGDTIIVFGATPAKPSSRYVHDPMCPVPGEQWEPVVIKGGKCHPAAQLSLPFLAVVEEEP